MPRPRRRLPEIVVLWGLSAAVLSATTAPYHFVFDPGTLARRWSEVDWVFFYLQPDGSWSPGLDFLVNLLLLVPLGVALALTGPLRRPRHVAFEAALVGLALSATAEALQLLVPGRFTQLADVARNTVGCVLAAVLAAGLRAWARQLPSQPAKTPAQHAAGSEGFQL